MKRNFKSIFIVLAAVIGLQSALTTHASAGIVETTCEEARDYYTEFGLIYVWVGKNNREKRQLIPIYGMMNMENKKRICGGRKGMRYYYVRSLDQERCKVAKWCG